MQRVSIVGWIVGWCTCLRLSQRKTLGELVFGAMRCRRVSLADIGRSLDSSALVKHSIKRVYRFLSNNRVEAAEGCRALVWLAAKGAGWRVFISVDWTDIAQYKVLRAAVPLRGRSVPVLFAAYRKWELYKSQNHFEEGFFRLLRTMLPPRAEVVILADRGFDRADLARTLQGLELRYVIRTGTRVSFRSEKWSGMLDLLPMRAGRHKDLGFGLYRKSRPVRQRVVVWWKSGEREPWFLVSDLEWGWRKIVAAFGLRMSIEELFRDEKNLRYGWGMRQVRLSSPERLERLILILSFAYLWLLLIGMLSQDRFGERHWASAVSRRRQASAFFVGRLMHSRHTFKLPELLASLARTLSQIVKENWG